MNTYVNFETAKLLKEKGFDINCGGYTVNGKMTGIGDSGKQYSAPTIAETVMWLYEKHDIWISVFTMDKWPPNDKDKDQIFDYTIKQMILGLIDIPKKFEEFTSPKEAYEAAIEYTLKHLI